MLLIDCGVTHNHDNNNSNKMILLATISACKKCFN